MVRLTDRPDITLDVYRGRKTTIQQQQQFARQRQFPSLLSVYGLKGNVPYLYSITIWPVSGLSSEDSYHLEFRE